MTFLINMKCKIFHIRQPKCWSHRVPQPPPLCPCGTDQPEVIDLHVGHFRRHESQIHEMVEIFDTDHLDQFGIKDEQTWIGSFVIDGEFVTLTLVVEMKEFFG